MNEIKFHEQSDGWTVERSNHDKVVFHIKRPNEIGGGWVSINLNTRCFGLGNCLPRRASWKSEYEGRGWKNRLVADAVAALSTAMK